MIKLSAFRAVRMRFVDTLETRVVSIPTPDTHDNCESKKIGSVIMRMEVGSLSEYVFRADTPLDMEPERGRNRGKARKFYIIESLYFE